MARTPRNPAKNPVEALSSFEGRDVLQSSIKVTNAGDGLSDAMLVDPAEYHLGDSVYVVLECVVARVDYQALTGVDALRRVHTLRAGTATVVSPELVSDEPARGSAMAILPANFGRITFFMSAGSKS